MYGSSAMTSKTRFKDPVQLFLMFSKLVTNKHEPGKIELRLIHNYV